MPEVWTGKRAVEAHLRLWAESEQEGEVSAAAKRWMNRAEAAERREGK